MPEWVKIVEREGDSAMELQLEADGTVLLENLRNVSATATTLKFRNPANQAWRVVKCVDDVLQPPSEDGWGDHTFLIVEPKGQEKKRKMTEDPEEDEDGQAQYKVNKCIYVLFDSEGKLTEGDLRDYFSEFGTITNINGQFFKGYAFVTFEAAIQSHQNSLLGVHFIKSLILSPLFGQC